MINVKIKGYIRIIKDISKAYLRRNSMEIVIDGKVKEYLRGIGKRTITIYTEIVGSCWSPRPEIFIRTGEPEAPENYRLFKVDNINVYLYNDLKTENKIEVKMSEQFSDLPNKEITVEGIELSR